MLLKAKPWSRFGFARTTDRRPLQKQVLELAKDSDLLLNWDEPLEDEDPKFLKYAEIPPDGYKMDP